MVRNITKTTERKNKSMVRNIDKIRTNNRDNEKKYITKTTEINV